MIEMTIFKSCSNCPRLQWARLLVQLLALLAVLLINAIDQSKAETNNAQALKSCLDKANLTDDKIGRTMKNDSRDFQEVLEMSSHSSDRVPANRVTDRKRPFNQEYTKKARTAPAIDSQVPISNLASFNNKREAIISLNSPQADGATKSPVNQNEVQEKVETTAAQVTMTTQQGSHYQMLLVEREKESRNVSLAGESERQAGWRPQRLLGPKTGAFYSSVRGVFQLQPSGTRGAEPVRLERRARSAQLSGTSGASKPLSLIRAPLGHRLIIPCGGNLTSGEQTVALLAPTSARQRQHHSSQGGSTRLRGNGVVRHGGGGGPSVAPANGQGISTIVWHKDEQLNSPIFVVDARGATSLREAKQQTESEALRGRAHLEESTRLDARGFGSTPALVIEGAQSEDGGVYTCTVEFHLAPTQTHQVRVELINPPRKMFIRDDSQERLVPGLIGPYDEDSRLHLSCEAEPGEPQAEIGWWQLQSVSVLPPGYKQAPQVESSGSARQWEPAGEQRTVTYEHLTTLALPESGELAGIGQEDSSPSSPSVPLSATRDLFVAFHPTAVPEVSQLVLPTAPESGIYSLRHWSRVAGQSLVSPGEKIQAALQLSLTRSNFGQEFLCLAHNNQFSAPLNASVRINMNLKPASVKIVNKNGHAFRLGKKVMLECQVHGSRPNAKVTWFRGAKELEISASPYNAGESPSLAPSLISELNRDTNNNNLTKISYLTLVPQLSDNQQSLTCSASNPKMPNAPSISDSLIMNVQFPAQMSLQFGTSIQQDSIRLGADVFMDCHIQSNPPIEDLTWLFEGQPITANVSAGIIISNQSLVLQRIRIENRGKYQCMAQNALGKSYSNSLELKPKFVPICDYTLTKTRYEVGLNQAAKIECHVLAEPDDDINFTWKFNLTYGDRKELESSSLDSISSLDSSYPYHLDSVKHYETNKTKSHVMFTPKTRRSYGQFLCTATNLMGPQERPCVIQVVPSELPGPVFDCFFENLTNVSLSVHCQAPLFGPGSRQNYLLELYTNKEQALDPSTSPAATHLRQRQEERNQLFGDERSNDNSDDDDDDESPRYQVKRLTSDSPSFFINDLRPDTSYQVRIYVQNSKGRSQAATYQANTLPALRAEGSRSGRVQFSSKGFSSSDSPGSWERLVTYLQMKDYFGADRTKPVIAVLLVAMLSVVSVLLLAFGASRLCGATRNGTNNNNNGANKNANNKRRRSKNLVAPASLSCLDANQGDKLSVYDGRAPKLDKNVQLTPASNSNNATVQRMKALAGSGSDTSRETNTDSTLVSSSRATWTEASLDRQQKQPQKSILTRSSSRVSQPVQVSQADHHHHQARMMPKYLNGPDSPVSLTTIPRASGDIGGEKRQNAAGLYSSAVKRANLTSPIGDHEAHSNTPQVSMQSESDCTSNNELLQAETLQEFQEQPLLIKCHDSAIEPVYVISRKGLQVATGGEHSLTPQQIQLVDSLGNFWPCSEPIDTRTNGGNSISAGTQVSSLCTADSFDRTTSGSLATAFNAKCQLLSEQPAVNDVQQQPLAGYLPSSLSIPVSLSNCFQLTRDPRDRSGGVGQQHHRHSHDFLPSDLCVSGGVGAPYFTLGPSNQLRYQSQQSNYATYYADQDLQQAPVALDASHQETPSLSSQATQSIGHHYHCASDGGAEVSQQQRPSSNSNYCAQTLDNAQRQQHNLQRRPGGQISSLRRGSFNGELDHGSYPERQVKFEVPRMSSAAFSVMDGMQESDLHEARLMMVQEMPLGENCQPPR